MEPTTPVVKKEVFDYPEGMSETEVLTQVREEIRQSEELTNQKRNTMRTRLALLNNQMKRAAQGEKTGDDLLFRLVDTSMAISYANKPLVHFAGRNFAGSDAASTLNRVAKFDYEEMELETADWFTQFDRFLYGVGIKMIQGWDKDRLVPIAKSMDTMSWLPDPKGYGTAKSFRWMGWENEYNKDEMTADMYFDESAVTLLRSDAAPDNRQSRQVAAQMSPSMPTPGTEGNGACTVYDMLTTLKGEKYMVTLDKKQTVVLRMRKIRAVSAKERANAALIPWPVSLHYYFPMRDNPFGLSLGDLAEDKQRGRAVLKNLHIAAVRAGLYPMTIYDKTMIRNRRSLDYRAGGSIGVNGPVTDSVVRPMPRDIVDVNSAMAVEMQLDTDAENAVGINKNMQGGVSAGGGTLGEQQQIQNNSNLRQLLRISVWEWGEKDFWLLWRRTYRAEYTSGKDVPVSTAFGEQFESVASTAFDTKEDPRISFRGALEEEAKNNSDRAYFNALYPILAQDTTKPQISKRIAERRLLKLNGVAEEDIYIMVPKSMAEIEAEAENILLAHGKDDVDVDIDEDHDTHMIMHSQINTAQARNHILKHMQFKMELKQDAGYNQGTGVGTVDNPQSNIAQQQMGSMAMKDAGGSGKMRNVTANPDAGSLI